MENTSAINKELVCVLFPGNVKNEEKAIQCLGGLKSISQVCEQNSKKNLTLSFQPDNPYVKKINGDIKTMSGILLKVKVKKKKEDGKIKREVLNTSVVGHVKKIHKFESLCDFQYLPITSSATPECLLEKIIPSGLDDINFMDEPAPLYIVPGSFSRFDKPMNYFYTDKKTYVSKNEDLAVSDGIDKDEVHKMRTERAIPIRGFSFNLVDDIPTEPNEYFIDVKNAKVAVNPQLNDEFEVVKKMFDQRPVWSYNHIKHHTKYRNVNLKIILPCLALHHKNGPWRMLWVKIGYDPRKEPHARYYQTLDFRLRHAAGVYSSVSRNHVGVKKNRVKRVAQEDTSEEIIPEETVYLKPHTLPSQRQIFYMYCDIHLPEVQEILSSEPPSGYLCHPKRGWLPANTAQTCRDIIFKYLKQNVIENKQADLKFEQASSDEASESDGEEPSAAGTADISI